MTTLVWINNFIRGLVIKGRSKEDPVCAFILSYIDNSSFLVALHVHGLPHPYNLRSTWQPEVSWNVNQIMPLFLLKPSNGHVMSLTESPQKTHSPYPDPQGSSCLNCQLILWIHLLSPPFLLTHSAPPKLVPAKIGEKAYYWNRQRTI